MARKNDSRMEATADPKPVAPVSYASVLSVDGRFTWFTLTERLPREPHAGACACEACRAMRLADLAIRFY